MRIRLGRVGNISLECSPLILLPVLYALLIERPGALLLNLLALFLHELCHTIAATLLGHRVKSIELQPFGFIARMEKRIGSRKDELAIAAAGPLFSLVTAAFCAALSSNIVFPGSELIRQFGRTNLFLGAINLLPALPLDGGRIAEAVLGNILPQRSASRVLLLLGAAFGFAAMGLGIFAAVDAYDRVMLFVAGIFLILAVFHEYRRSNERQIDALLRRIENIRSSNGVPVHFIAMHKSACVGDVLYQMDSRGITYVIVLDDFMEEIGRLSETEMLNGIAQAGVNTTLYEILMLR